MARKRSPDSTNDRQRIQFAFNADRDTSIGRVFKYLLKNDKLPSRKGKHKGLDAMAAFWSPFAYQEDEGMSEDEKRAIARESVEALTRQVDLIREAFDLEKPQASGELREDMKAVFAEVIQELVGSNPVALSPVHSKTLSGHTELSPSTKPASTSAEGVDFDEDALLGGLFEGSEIAA